MKPIGTHNYFVYITTNTNKNVMYVGVTNNLKRRLHEHEQDSLKQKVHFTGKYNAIYIIYWERFNNIELAIKREKQIKGWTRNKKDNLVNSFNPRWIFLNKEIMSEQY